MGTLINLSFFSTPSQKDSIINIKHVIELGGRPSLFTTFNNLLDDLLMD